MIGWGAGRRITGKVPTVEKMPPPQVSATLVVVPESYPYRESENCGLRRAIAIDPRSAPSLMSMVTTYKRRSRSKYPQASEKPRVIQEIIIVQVLSVEIIQFAAQETEGGDRRYMITHLPSPRRPAQSEIKSKPITEIRSLITHPPQLLIGVLQPTGFSGFPHDGLLSCVGSVVRGNYDRQHDKPQTYEP